MYEQDGTATEAFPMIMPPIGISDFRKIRNEGLLFADKSLIIRDIIRYRSYYVLFTRPRRFGKSTVLSMFDRFFNIAYAEEEKQYDSFAGLKLSHCPEYIEWRSEGGLRNSIPVIFLDLSFVSSNGSGDFNSMMSGYLRDIVDSSFPYLSGLDEVDGDPGDYVVGGTGTDVKFPGLAFTILCRLLTKYHGSSPLVLVDEYDKPLERAYGTDCYDSVLLQYSAFLDVAFKANRYVSRIIMTGVQRLVVHGMFSTLNNFQHFGVSSRFYREYFGYTSDEVKAGISAMVEDRFPDMGRDEKESLISTKFEVARYWYDGYNVGGVDIFNPWSISNFLANDIDNDDGPRDYWNITSENNIMVSLLSGASEGTLSSVKSMYIGNREQFHGFSDYNILIRPGQDVPGSDMFSLLVFAGYMTIECDHDICSVWIPNREVRDNYDDLMKRIYSISVPSVVELLKDIVRNDPHAVRKDLEDLMSGGSYLDGWSEQRYKSWLHDIFALHGYISITEREAGEGRIDLLVEAYKGMPAIVFEFKVVEPDSSEDLLEAASSGVAQIEDRRYTDSIGMAGAIALSVAFRKKTCEVVFAGRPMCQ